MLLLVNIRHLNNDTTDRGTISQRMIEVRLPFNKQVVNAVLHALGCAESPLIIRTEDHPELRDLIAKYGDIEKYSMRIAQIFE